MLKVCSADIYFLWALDARNKKKEEDGRIVGVFKFKKSP